MKVAVKNTLIVILGLSFSLFLGYSLRNPDFDLFNIPGTFTYAFEGFLELLNIVGGKLQSIIG
ncbi:hypothetical protein [Paenibacillus glacialis]|uniref:Uncharacterized protein n=1 Tax=Paenibacillus glacialis TaxID=494026 RepID=A0A168MAQ4_9BACL|nr:hypothetical protein [Paenibacillus glacialis]OAB44445.1 hypothetical protein PGLA_07260 [Paenibacillus glacialis]